jgi:hypothetical protein
VLSLARRRVLRMASMKPSSELDRVRRRIEQNVRDGVGRYGWQFSVVMLEETYCDGQRRGLAFGFAIGVLLTAACSFLMRVMIL